jgi:outer membrane receptor protein involved in Fe transport
MGNQIGPPENLVQLNNFNGTGLTTSGATPSTGHDPLKIERAQLFDVGVTQNLFDGLKAGVDLYYKFARNGVDFGQFGAPIITIPFNYRIVANRGVELTTTYENGPFSYYGNLAIAQQQAKASNPLSSIFRRTTWPTSIHTQCCAAAHRSAPSRRPSVRGARFTPASPRSSEALDRGKFTADRRSREWPSRGRLPGRARCVPARR